MVKNHCFRI